MARADFSHNVTGCVVVDAVFGQRKWGCTAVDVEGDQQRLILRNSRAQIVAVYNLRHVIHWTPIYAE